jgi:hypothetical protein
MPGGGLSCPPPDLSRRRPVGPADQGNRHRSTHGEAGRPGLRQMLRILGRDRARDQIRHDPNLGHRMRSPKSLLS